MPKSQLTRGLFDLCLILFAAFTVGDQSNWRYGTAVFVACTAIKSWES